MIAWLIFYSGLFLVTGLVCTIFLHRQAALAVRLERPTAAIWAAAAVWGGLSLHITLKLQPPIQMAYMRWVGNQLLTTPAQYLLFFPVALISGLVQELLKALPFAVLLLLGYRGRKMADFWAAPGFGFGVWEAIWLAAVPLAHYGGWYTPSVFERIYAIIFHVAAAFITGYGFAALRPIRFYLLAALMHGALNFGAVLYGGGVLGLWQTEIWGLAWALATLLIAWILGRKLLCKKEEQK